MRFGSANFLPRGADVVLVPSGLSYVLRVWYRRYHTYIVYPWNLKIRYMFLYVTYCIYYLNLSPFYHAL